MQRQKRGLAFPRGAGSSFPEAAGLECLVWGCWLGFSPARLLRSCILEEMLLKSLGPSQECPTPSTLGATRWVPQWEPVTFRAPGHFPTSRAEVRRPEEQEMGTGTPSSAELTLLLGCFLTSALVFPSSLFFPSSLLRPSEGRQSGQQYGLLCQSPALQLPGCVTSSQQHHSVCVSVLGGWHRAAVRPRHFQQGPARQPPVKVSRQRPPAAFPRPRTAPP